MLQNWMKLWINNARIQIFIQIRSSQSFKQNLKKPLFSPKKLKNLNFRLRYFWDQKSQKIVKKQKKNMLIPRLGMVVWGELGQHF